MLVAEVKLYKFGNFIRGTVFMPLERIWLDITVFRISRNSLTYFAPNHQNQ
jgi:hypothetical protein